MVYRIWLLFSVCLLTNTIHSYHHKQLEEEESPHPHHQHNNEVHIHSNKHHEHEHTDEWDDFLRFIQSDHNIEQMQTTHQSEAEESDEWKDYLEALESGHQAKSKHLGLRFFTNIESQPEKIIIFNTERYDEWSEWSECLPRDCIELRHRKCLDDSWEQTTRNKLQTTNCVSKYYAEKRSCSDERKCNSYIGSQIIDNLRETCGHRPDSVKLMPKIIGGHDAIPNSWPWVVRLAIKPPGKLRAQTFCGGTLIAPQWVLTAAHCLVVENKRLPVGRLINVADHMKSKLFAHVGDYNQVNRDEHEQNHEITKVVLHPRYHRKYLDNGDDIALAYLEQPVEQSRIIDFACLPANKTQIEPGTKCFALGWGSSRADSVPVEVDFQSVIDSLFSPFLFHFENPMSRPHYPWFKRRNTRRRQPDADSDRLQEVELPVVSIDACLKVYANLDEETHICAGSPGKDTCAGDSGGGLYCQIPKSDKWFVAGVTSFGLIYGCGRHPGIYTSVGAHMKWIQNSIALVKV